MAEAQRSRTIVLISLITIAASLVVMAGWIFNITILKQIVPGYVAMVFNTALCFVLFGAAVFVAQSERNKSLYVVLSTMLLLFSVLSLSQEVFHFNAGVDQFFVTDKAPIAEQQEHPGRMAVTVSLCFLVSGLSLTGFGTKNHIIHTVSQYGLHLVTVVAATALFGYLYGAPSFYHFYNTGAVSLPTAILLFLMSMVTSLWHPRLGVTDLFTGQLIGNKMARRFFVIMVLIVIGYGTVRVRAPYYYQYPLNTWVSLVSVSVLFIILLTLWNFATWLNKMDTLRFVAEEEVKRINADLENIIEDRTEAFKKSEAKYRLLIEHASDAIYVVDLKGNFTDVNDSMCKMTGYSRNVLLLMNVEDIIDPNELKVDPVKHGARSADESTIRERRFIRKDRTIFDAEISVKSFADDKVLIMARDITGRKKMEAELKEAEIKFRTLADQSMVGVYIFQQGKFVYVNPRFAEIFGYEPHELVGTYPVEVIIHQDYRATVRENVRKRMEEEVASIHYEVMGLKKDGSTNWIEFYGNRVVIAGEPTIIGSMLDITKRKEAEDLILKEKMLSETIINSLPGIFYLQNESGDYLRWNKNFETVMGYTKEEILKMKSREMVAPEDLERVRETVMKIFSEGSAVVEANGLTKDGTLIPFLITSVPIIYQDQQCILGTGIDISSRIKAQEELRLSEQKYKLLFESSPLPLWMVAKDDLTIIAVNDVAAKIYGYTRDELINNSVMMLRPPEDHDRQLAGDILDVSDGAVDVGVVKHLKKDGTPMFVNIVANDIIFEGRAVRLSFTNDITKRLKAEESLKKSEANLQTILNTTDTAYGLFDPALKALAFNQKAIEFTQTYYKHTPKKGDLFTDYYSKERLPQFLNLANEVLQGKHISYQADYPSENNEVSWFDVSLSPITDKSKKIIGLLLTMNDITERKKAEEDLRSAYSRIQTQVNSIKGMAWKQSHLMRSPLANLKALAGLLKDQPSDVESLAHFQTELDRMDAIIHEMAQDASDHVADE